MRRSWVVIPVAGLLAFGACTQGTSEVAAPKAPSQPDVALSYSPKSLPRNGWDEDFAGFALEGLAEGAEMSPSSDLVLCMLDHIIDNYTPEQMLEVDAEEVGIDGFVECAEWVE